MGDGSWRIVSLTLGLMFTRKASPPWWRRAVCAARCESTAGSRTRRRRWTVCRANSAVTASPLRFCHEAGPCGHGIQRQVTASGHECVVVAPSPIPRRPGDRVNATSLAKLHRAGELTAAWVSDIGREAMRDLVRARLDAAHSLRRARQRLSGFLLRQGCHYGRPAWTKLHRRWLAGLKFEQALHHLVLEDYIAAVEGTAARRDRLN